MDLAQTTLVMKALADKTRLQIVNTLIDKPQYVEELAERLGLAASTISTHLKKLEAAGLAKKKKDQYYSVYCLDEKILDTTLRALIAFEDSDKDAQKTRMGAYRKKIIDTFFDGERLVRMPAQRKKQIVILHLFVPRFAPGKVYSEKEVNAIILPVFDDYCRIRRDLVDERLMARDKTGYWLTDAGAAICKQTPVSSVTQTEKPTRRKTADTAAKSYRRAVKRAYKDTEKQAGIFRIVNKTNGRILLGSSLNLNGPLNRHRVELEMGSHRNRTLLAEWKRDGRDNFVFEIVEQVDLRGETDRSVEQELEKLETKWIELITPLDQRSYNWSLKIRQ